MTKKIGIRYSPVVSFFNRHARGVAHNALGQGVFYLFLAFCSAIRPLLAKIWNQPWEWSVNGVLFLVTIVLVIAALVQFVRALAASRRPILTEEDQTQLQERRKKAEAETMPQPVVERTIAESPPEVKLPPQYSGRQFVDVTPDYLMELFDQHTSIQAQRLIEPYIGKWMKVSGTLDDVVDSEQFSLITFKRAPSERFGILFMYFQQPDRRDRLSVIRRGAKLTVLGQIKRVNTIQLELWDCELI